MESRRNFATLSSPFFSEWCRVQLAPEKRQLLSRQQDERARPLVDLEQLEADYHKAIEDIRQKTRNKRFNHSITRSHRYHEEKSIWEYLNNIVEDIHLFTWRKTVIASCTDNYKQKRFLLEKELGDLDSQHRKERITLRYSQPTKSEEQTQDGPSPEPHVS